MLSDCVTFAKVLKRGLRLNERNSMIVIADRKNVENAEKIKKVSEAMCRKSDIIFIDNPEKYKKEFPKNVREKISRFDCIFLASEIPVGEVSGLAKYKKKKISGFSEVDDIINPKPKQTPIEMLRSRSGV